MGKYAKYGAVAVVEKPRHRVVFGSVEFFKRLILFTVAFLIITPFVFMLYFIFRSNQLSNEVERLNAHIAIINDSLEFNSSSSSINSYSTDDYILELIENMTPSQPNELFEPIGYQTLYPDMYVTPLEKVAHDGGKMAYLTFDDGPSNRTIEVLDILKKYDIKATFFVVYEDNEVANNTLKRIVDEGHTIAVHTASHDYDVIYASVESFLEDFNIIYEHIVDVTGVKPDLFRFAGGSINAYNGNIYTEVISEVLRRGFTYHDWNASAQDASNRATPETIYDSVISTTLPNSKAIVLMHDGGGRYDTITALPRIIDTLLENGYNFDKLDSSVIPFSFSYMVN